ncbi:MAG: hypothetical protein NC826_01785 [Candidatus Omnitrophica bacterium]|nr:hypothetical protein [Candidatus Omnitrophota bacterium]
MKGLNVVVKDILDKIKLKDQRDKSYLWQALNKVLTKKESRHIRYISLYRDILKLGIDSSVGIYCINQKKDKIVKKLRVKEVKFFLV